MSYAPPPSPPNVFGDEDQVQTEMPGVVEFFQDLARKLVVVIQFEQEFFGELFVRVLLKRRQNHLQEFRHRGQA